MNLDESIQIMTNEIVKILGDNKPSVYLYGSVALDDFKLGWSDIDFIVLTKRKLCAQPAETLVGLRQALSERYPNNPYFRLFEGGMRSVRALLANKLERTVYWGTNGQRITDSYYFDSFSVAELLDSGVLLHGEDVRSRFTRPTYADLRGDVCRHYETIRQHAKQTSHSIQSYGWLLDIARGIYTLRMGKVIAKTAAGEWALENGICPNANVLQKAVEVRCDPLAAKARKDILDLSAQLGDDIQQFADVLEKELNRPIYYHGTTISGLTELHAKPILYLTPNRAYALFYIIDKDINWVTCGDKEDGLVHDNEQFPNQFENRYDALTTDEKHDICAMMVKYIFKNNLLDKKTVKAAFIRDNFPRAWRYAGELNAMSITPDEIQHIRNKDGISVWRIKSGNASYVLKYYDAPEFRREIEAYDALSSLGIPTIRVIAKTECALLMEDLTDDESGYRLAVAEDLHDGKILKQIAAWYKVLHENGRDYAKLHKLYDENDALTLDNIKLIQQKTGTRDLSIWRELEDCFEKLSDILQKLPRTLTYNDFHFTNLSIKRDGSAALMFDYNMLGKGYVYADLRNVIYHMPSEARKDFLAAYGEFDHREIIVDDVLSILVTLFNACQRETFPSWANNALEMLKNGELSAAIQRFADVLGNDIQSTAFL